MASHRLSRREMLRALAVTVAVEPVLASAHAEGAGTASGPVPSVPERVYQPRFFDAHQYQTLRALCQAIIPSDEHSAGAIEAGAPQFIDLLTSENKKYQIRLGGGLMWLDCTCSERFGSVFLDSSPQQQNEILGLLAYRANGQNYPQLTQGIDFFSFLRDLTVDGFYTSAIGIRDLQYKGNKYLAEFPGCPWPE